ncbi:MAG TPA: hypothetical protein VFR86_07990, partial [Burkholderiaceae bacterium]|nr:hypothetical protein [Burkholderiaceae bacterium]
WRASRYFRYGVRFLAGVALSQLFFRIDRLVLAQMLPAHDFGIYGTAMQLVDVWLHMVHVIGFSIGPAYLYAALSRTTHPLAHWRTIAVLTGIGLSGLLLAIVFGKPAIALIFGPKFGGSYAYLIAGTAFAVLAFIDSFASTSVTATRRPGALALKWGTSAVVAATTQIILFPSLHGFAGPVGLATGIVMGWVVLIMLPSNNNRSVGAAPTQGAQA